MLACLILYGLMLSVRNLGVICPLICILISHLLVQWRRCHVCTLQFQSIFQITKQVVIVDKDIRVLLFFNEACLIMLFTWSLQLHDPLWNVIVIRFEFKSLKSFIIAVLTLTAMMKDFLDAFPWHITERLLCVYSLLPSLIQSSRLHNKFTDPKNSLNSLTPQPI